MEQALGLEHIDIGHRGQARVAGQGFVQRRKIIAGHPVGPGPGGLALGRQVVGRFQPGQPAALLGLMEFDPRLGGQHQHQVGGFGKRRVVGARAAHIDYALLGRDQAAGGEHGRAFQHQGLAFAHGRIQGADEAGEDLPRAGDFGPGLQGVLDRHYPHLFAGMGQVQLHFGQALVFHYEGL